MNKAFTKETEAEIPEILAHRAPLPPGVTNYVTPRGLSMLREELATLVAERARLDGMAEGAERSHAHFRLAQRKSELEERLARAALVNPSEQPRDEARFGAMVTVRTESGEEKRYQIVGADEADAKVGRIAFFSPLARALLGRSVGDSTPLWTPRGGEELEIVRIEYDVTSIR